MFDITYYATLKGSTFLRFASYAIYVILFKTLSNDTSSFLSIPSLLARFMTNIFSFVFYKSLIFIFY